MNNLSIVTQERPEQNEISKTIEFLCEGVNDNGEINCSDLKILFSDEKHYGSRILNLKFSSRFGYVERFLRDIDYHINKIDSINICDSNCGYQFPLNSTVEKYKSAFDMAAGEEFVNDSKERVAIVKKNLLEMFYSDSTRLYNICITGKVGCGKSQPFPI